MKKITLILIVLIVLVFTLFAMNNRDIEAEKAAIKQAALDNIEGWYEGNAEEA